jgi:hypothetical protein
VREADIKKEGAEECSILLLGCCGSLLLVRQTSEMEIMTNRVGK